MRAAPLLLFFCAGVAGCSVNVDLRFGAGGTTLPTPTPTPLDLQSSAPVNECWPVSGLSATSVTTPGPLLVEAVVGSLLILHQVKHEVLAGSFFCNESGDELGETDIGAIGRYEIVQVESVDTFTFTLARAISSSFVVGPGAVQVCTFPVFSTVVIDGSAVMLPARDWDGETGGLVAFGAEDSVTLNGPIDVDGRGFSGGEGTDNSGTLPTPPVDMTQCDYGNPDWSGGKGSGMDGRDDGSVGRGNAGNAGGGGNWDRGGGGGGAGAGRGGNGGLAFSGSAGTNGLGGLAVLSTTPRLIYGGGGGGGHTALTGVAGDGAPGGGAVLIRSPQVLGNGSVFAGGSYAFNSGTHGAGGGGGGGTVIFDVDDTTGFGSEVSVTGGAGGGVTDGNCIGAGGGGGGGRVWSRTLLPVQMSLPGGSRGLNGGPNGSCDINNPASDGGGGDPSTLPE